MPLAIVTALEEWAQQVFHRTLGILNAVVTSQHLLLYMQDSPRFQVQENALGGSSVYVGWYLYVKGCFSLSRAGLHMCFAPPAPPVRATPGGEVLGLPVWVRSIPILHRAVAAFVVYGKWPTWSVKINCEVEELCQKGSFPWGMVFTSHQNQWKIGSFHRWTLLDLQNLPI